jgi:NAD(P)-dependent dehydrogenase (short-subunit alcohol dehydrogenase family)
LAGEIGDRALAVPCDVSSPDQVKAAFAAIAERHPKIDVLINNAAVYAPFLLAEATDDQVVNTIAINLTGAILCARSAIPMMGRGGTIINVSSESVDMPFPLLVLYQTSKAGLEKFSLTLQSELEPSGIRVSFVRAGQMMDADKTWDADPAALMRFAQAAMAAGLDLAKRPLSQYVSVTQVFRALIDLPPDLLATQICLHARASE